VSARRRGEPEQAPQEPRQPHRVRLPGFVDDRDIGLGDVVTRVTQAVGITPCGRCKRRAAALNRWMVFTRR
jgi:hypothetical protein